MRARSAPKARSRSESYRVDNSSACDRSQLRKSRRDSVHSHESFLRGESGGNEVVSERAAQRDVWYVGALYWVECPAFR